MDDLLAFRRDVRVRMPVTAVDRELLSFSLGSSTCASGGTELGVSSTMAPAPWFEEDNICESGILGTCPSVMFVVSPASDTLTAPSSASARSAEIIEMEAMYEEKQRTWGGIQR